MTDRKEYMQEYYKKNKDKLKEQQKTYYRTHKEQIKEQQKAYRQANPEYKQAHRDYLRKTQNAENSQSRWANWEIDLVMSHEITDIKLAKKIGRSVAAILTMRCRIKKGA